MNLRPTAALFTSIVLRKSWPEPTVCPVHVDFRLRSAWSEADRLAARTAAERAITATAPLLREDAAVRQLAAHGVAVVRITPAGHDAFRATVRNVEARWREAIGSDVVALAESALGARPPPAGKGP